MTKMAKTCGSCGLVVSDDVQLCENCGYQFASDPKADIRVKGRGGLLGFSVLLVLIVFALVYYWHSQQTQTAKPPESPLDVEASTVYDEYEANAIAADLKYKNTLLRIKGLVEHIDKDILGSPYIVLRGSGAIFGVQCMFSRDQTSTLASVRHGSEVVIVGRCSGKLGNVLIENSRVEDSHPAITTGRSGLSITISGDVDKAPKAKRHR